MNDNNPRKELRKHINHLRREKAALDLRSKKFKDMIEKLSDIEKNSSIEDCKFAANSFNYLNWLAFPI